MTRNSARAAIYFLLIVLPILTIGTCDGWSGGPFSHCLVNTEFVREYASFYATLLVVSSFFLGIPVLIYIWLAIVFTERVAKQIAGDGKKQSADRVE